MIIKEKFSLLKNLSNTIDLSSYIVDAYKIDSGPRKLFVLIKLLENRINHFSKDVVINLISDTIKREKIDVVNIPNYLLPITYNKRTDSIVINLIAFESSGDVSKCDPKDLYASLVYGITFSTLVKGLYNIDKKYFTSISNMLISILIRLFGKDFGLIGPLATEIPKLKFILNCYILKAFFGVGSNESYHLSGSVSSYDYKSIEEQLPKYDFSTIDDFILALNNFRVMPGINKYTFSSKILKLFGAQNIVMFEDLSRFMSIMCTSSLLGSSVCPTFIKKYNEIAYNEILEICKNLFRKIQ